MQLLVSVADAPEARAALLGGADVIDAKDPRGGALGAVRPERLRTLCDAVGTGRPLSAALGDRGPPALVERRAGAAAQVGAAFVKLGFRGAAAVSQARRRAAAARRGAGPRTGLVLVGYADWRRAHGIDPDALLALAIESGAVGVLLDTALKDTGLFTRLEPDAGSTGLRGSPPAGLIRTMRRAPSIPASQAAIESLVMSQVWGSGSAARTQRYGARTGRRPAWRAAAISACCSTSTAPGRRAVRACAY